MYSTNFQFGSQHTSQIVNSPAKQPNCRSPYSFLLSRNFYVFCALGAGVILLFTVFGFLVWHSSIRPGGLDAQLALKVADGADLTDVTRAFLLTDRAFAKLAASDPAIARLQKACLLRATVGQLSHYQTLLAQQQESVPAVAKDEPNVGQRIDRIQRLSVLYREVLSREKALATAKQEFLDVAQRKSSFGPATQEIIARNRLSGREEKLLAEAEQQLRKFARGSEIDDLRRVWPSGPPKSMPLTSILDTARNISRLDHEKASLTQAISRDPGRSAPIPGHLPFLGKRSILVRKNLAFVTGVADGDFVIMLFGPDRVLLSPVTIRSRGLVEVELLDHHYGLSSH